MPERWRLAARIATTHRGDVRRTDGPQKRNVEQLLHRQSGHGVTAYAERHRCRAIHSVRVVAAERLRKAWRWIVVIGIRVVMVMAIDAVNVEMRPRRVSVRCRDARALVRMRKTKALAHQYHRNQQKGECKAHQNLNPFHTLARTTDRQSLGWLGAIGNDRG